VLPNISRKLRKLEKKVDPRRPLDRWTQLRERLNVPNATPQKQPSKSVWLKTKRLTWSSLNAEDDAAEV
jgi:hypothetical protein